MLSKSQFLNLIDKETHVLKHLHGKLDDGDLDYRPAEGSRSTLELLQYLSHCAISPAHAIVHDDWSSIGARQEEAAQMTTDQFPARLDRQIAALRELLEGVSDEDLASRQVTLPWGEQMALGESLVNTTLKFFTAYRMQLFIYAKARGHELTTHNCWLGVDPPPPAS